ncbi:MAG: bifunctional 3,4-dihydroxy-2-butanone-4-phosphate synthase/GTP cyclohydrolase II [Corynebacterium sp.]|nr:bifunctional 3,4-dihydroxy-2-butanone-4-phosphate synthase/GTP cyclohydrolase II [Corynebacterium sp.]
MDNSAAAESAIHFDTIPAAIAALQAGKPVVVVDAADRENEGDLIFPAAAATPELVAFMVRYSSGYICVALESDACERLHLPPMTTHNEDVRQTAYAVTVDAVGTTTGISAADRALTLQQLANPQTRPQEFTRPGHVVPLRAKAGGVLERPGHTEAAADLSRLAGFPVAGALCEIVSEEEPTGMARLPELARFAQTHDLPLMSIADLVQWRQIHDAGVESVVATKLPTEFGDFQAIGYRESLTGQEHVALVKGDPASTDAALVRIHSECLTGDVFGSRRCDCGPQLHLAMQRIQAEGHGVVVYMRGHEGRGIGLLPKLQAYQLQDEGADTVDANVQLGLPEDARDYHVAAAILHDLGLNLVRLLTNNPAKVTQLERFEVQVIETIALPTEVYAENMRYLRTKRDRMGHLLPWLDEQEPTDKAAVHES